MRRCYRSSSGFPPTNPRARTCSGPASQLPDSKRRGWPGPSPVDGRRRGSSSRGWQSRNPRSAFSCRARRPWSPGSARLWLSPDGEIEALAPVAARARLRSTRPRWCATPAQWRGASTWREWPGSTFWNCSRVCAAGRNSADADAARDRRRAGPRSAGHDGGGLRRAQATAARALLQQLQAEGDPDTRTIAEATARAGWAWGPAVLAALPAGEPGGALRPGEPVCARGKALPRGSGQERPPPPMPGNAPVSAEDARRRLAALLGDGAEARPQQADYAAAVAAAFAPREREGVPQAVLAEAGTGVGKTLGYIAPASLWAEKNQGAVWISTFTRNLQSQISGELDRLYPDPVQKRRRVVVRKGRENFLCLLNYEDAARAATARGAQSVAALALIARWIGATAAGDLVGGDFPGWLAELIGCVAGSMRWPTGAANASTRPARISAAALSRRTCGRRATPGWSSPTTPWLWRRPPWAGSTTPPCRRAMCSTKDTICSRPPTPLLGAPFRPGRGPRVAALAARRRGRAVSRARGLQRRIGDLVEAPGEAGEEAGKRSDRGAGRGPRAAGRWLASARRRGYGARAGLRGAARFAAAPGAGAR